VGWGKNVGRNVTMTLCSRVGVNSEWSCELVFNSKSIIEFELNVNWLQPTGSRILIEFELKEVELNSLHHYAHVYFDIMYGYYV
jgi:hypothetical protein